ncbi:putative glycosylase [Ochrobactrum phage vB_OspM_OC]|nr:putative glycosylase [Ochrobactrum phage vB_OspM_OC]
MVNKNLLNATFQNNPSILSGYRNKIINGDFGIWQRGTTFSSSGYTADRWGLSLNGSPVSTASVSRQAFPMGDASIPGNTESYWRLNITSGGDATYGFVGAYHLIENVRNLANTKVTLTFYARADVAGKKVGIGNPQSFGSTGDPRVDRHIGIATLDTSWKKFQFVWTVNSITGKTRGGGNDWVGIEYYFSAGTNYDARSGGIGIQTGIIDIARVSLVEGDASNEFDPFSPRHYQQELALCQRYCCVVKTGIQISASGFGLSYFYFPVQMRATPTYTTLNTGYINNATSQTVGDITVTGGYIQIQATAANGYITGWYGLFTAD